LLRENQLSIIFEQKRWDLISHKAPQCIEAKAHVKEQKVHIYKGNIKKQL